MLTASRIPTMAISCPLSLGAKATPSRLSLRRCSSGFGEISALKVHKSPFRRRERSYNMRMRRGEKESRVKKRRLYQYRTPSLLHHLSSMIKETPTIPKS